MLPLVARRFCRSFWKAFFLLASIASLEAVESWQRLADLPEPNGGMALVATPEGLRVLGGTDWKAGEKIWYDQIWDWSAQRNQWRSVGRLPAPWAYGAALETSKGVLVLGGNDQRGAVLDTWLLNSQGKSQQATIGFPGGSTSAAVRWKDAWIVFARNQPDAQTGLSGSAWIFRQGQWQVLEPLPSGAWISPALAVVGDQLLVAAGARWGAFGGVTNANEVWSYSLEQRSWRKMGTLPLYVRGMTAWTIDAQTVYLAGGYEQAPGTTVGSFSKRGFLLSLANETVVPSLDLPYAGMVHGASNESHLFVVGGEDQMRHRSSAVYRIEKSYFFGSAKP